MSGVTPKELLTRLSPLIDPTTDLGGTPVPQDYVIKGSPGLAWTVGPAPPPIAPTYTVLTLPAATTAGAMIFVSDATGGAVLAFADGTNWRRSTDRSVVN